MAVTQASTDVSELALRASINTFLKSLQSGIAAAADGALADTLKELAHRAVGLEERLNAADQDALDNRDMLSDAVTDPGLIDQVADELAGYVAQYKKLGFDFDPGTLAAAKKPDDPLTQIEDILKYVMWGIVAVGAIILIREVFKIKSLAKVVTA